MSKELTDEDLNLNIRLTQQWTLDGLSYQHELNESDIEHHNYTLDLVDEDDTIIKKVGNIDTYSFSLEFQPDFSDFDAISQELMEFHVEIDNIIEETDNHEAFTMVYLDQVSVIKEYRGKGIAKQMVTSILNIINDRTEGQTLFVLKPGALPSTQGQFPYSPGIKKKLIKFYESCGFQLLDNGYMIHDDL